MPSPVLLWYRQDLRVNDHPALHAACAKGVPIIPVYIWDPDAEGNWPIGAASKIWLRESLQQFSKSLEQLGSRLIIATGETEIVLKQLLKATEAQAVYAQRRYEPAARALENKLQYSLPANVVLHEGALLHEPEVLLNQQGKPYQVYTPFWKALQNRLPEILPLLPPKQIPAPTVWPDSIALEDLPLLPPKHEPRWDKALIAHWQVGEKAAQENLTRFIKQTIAIYETGRNLPGEVGTSRLSPHLHFGEITPRQIWYAVHEHFQGSKSDSVSAQVFLKEVAWREFSHHLLFHFPHTTNAPMKTEFQNFPWHENKEFLERWQQGLTGYPIIDAGMRELWATGWMHNRVRMIVASFLVKNLLVPWQSGAHWFLDTLVDADLAQNTLGWQWVAGCGADAAPYFRIFNPILQGGKFDPNGAYIRRWIPELKDMPTKRIHQPWEVSEQNHNPPKRSDKILLNRYPEPMVDHISTRDKALAAYKMMRSQA